MPEATTFHVLSLVGTPICVSASDGQKVYNAISARMHEGSRVTLSFDGVETLISAFLNAAIGQLYNEFSEAQIRELFTVTEMSRDDLAILKRVVENAKRYFSNREAEDAAWKAEVGDESEQGY